jgi:hypothetical protein
VAALFLFRFGLGFQFYVESISVLLLGLLLLRYAQRRFEPSLLYEPPRNTRATLPASPANLHWQEDYTLAGCVEPAFFVHPPSSLPISSIILKTCSYYPPSKKFKR